MQGTRLSTVVRKKEVLKEHILKMLKNSENPLSTSDLVLKLERAWHTIDRTCLMLQIENKIKGFRVGNMNLLRIP